MDIPTESQEAVALSFLLTSVERSAEDLRHPSTVERWDWFEVEDAKRLGIPSKLLVADPPAGHELIEAERAGEVQSCEDLGEGILASPVVLPPGERGFGGRGVEPPCQTVGDALEGGVIFDEASDPFLDERGRGPVISFNARAKRAKILRAQRGLRYLL